MKKLFLLFMLLLLPLFLFGQTSNLTATITDSDSQTWNNGAFTITFVGIPGVAQYQWNGAPLDLAHQMFTGIMNGSGAMSAAIPDSSTISPSGTQWRFTLCSDTSAPCSNVTTPVTGGSPNLSATLSAGVKAPRINAGTGSFAYADAEINPVPTVGLTYWNVTTPGLRIWNGSAWLASGGSGSGTVTIGTQCYYAAYLLATASVSPILPFAYPGECLGISAALSDNASIINAAAVALTAIGPGNRLKLPPGEIKGTSAALILKSTILVGADSGIPGWNPNDGPTPPPATWLHLTHDDTATAHIQCLSNGNCGLENIQVVDDATASPFMLYTCGNPWLNNVTFIGKQSAITGTPVNDALLFGSAPGHTGSNCNDATQGYVAYNGSHINNLFFQNIRQWVGLYDNANLITFHDLRGNFTDSNQNGYAIFADAPGTSVYGATFDGVVAEGANFNTHVCLYKGIFGLNRNVAGFDFSYGTSDVGDCPTSYVAGVYVGPGSGTGASTWITDATALSNNGKALSGSYVNGALSDVSTSSGNGFTDLPNHTFRQQTLLGINLGTTGTAISGWNKLLINNGGVMGFIQGSTPFACDVAFSRGGTGGFLKLGNCTAGNSSGRLDLTTLNLGTDGSVAGVFNVSNGSASAHTSWGSAATTSNTIAGPAVVPPDQSILGCSTTSTTCTLTATPVAVVHPQSSTQSIVVTGTIAVQGTLVTLLSSNLTAGTYLVGESVEEAAVGTGCTTATGTFRIEFGYVDLDSGATFTINSPGYVLSSSTGSGNPVAVVTYATTISRSTQGSAMAPLRINTGTALTARLVETAVTSGCSVQPTYNIALTVQGPL